jgi:HAD superfamily phosphoserine phosphatase-like hydrolase
MRDLCVFDLDGTLIAYDSFGKIVRRNLIRHPILAAAGLLRKAGFVSRSKFASLAHRQLISPLSDIQLQSLADEVVSQVIGARRDIIELWRSKGAFLALMSASPDEYVSHIGARLGFDAVHGSRFEAGQYLHVYGQTKVDLLERYYPTAMWRRTFAISDSLSDSPLLSKFDTSQFV